MSITCSWMFFMIDFVRRLFFPFWYICISVSEAPNCAASVVQLKTGGKQTTQTTFLIDDTYDRSVYLTQTELLKLRRYQTAKNETQTICSHLVTACSLLFGLCLLRECEMR